MKEAYGSCKGRASGNQRKNGATKRRTKITAAADEMDDEDLIEEKQVAITLTHLGYLKRVSADTYKTQKRGGKGITGLTTREKRRDQPDHDVYPTI